MLIDLAEENQRRNEPIRALTRWMTRAGSDNLAKQLKLLDETCPRYDVHNIYAALFPKVLGGDYAPALKRNAELIGRRDALLNITSKAPLGPPWHHFYLECRLNEEQRGGFLVRWDAENRKYDCTMMFDSVRTEGMIEINPDAFGIHLGDDDMFSRYEFARNPAVANIEGVKMAAQLIRTCIELLNWDREDVPIMTYTDEKHGKPKGKKKERTSKKSTPTIIKFEPFLKNILSRTHRASEDGRASATLHLVRGHYKNFRYEAPLFGHKPVLGRTYGRLWRKPHQSGNSSGGVAKTPNAVMKIGEMACA
jgi:hypothetical protein